MSRQRQDLGRAGEELALRHLRRLGYRAISRNYRCALGEVDLIARDGDTLVFVEIKTRRHRSTAFAKEAVNARKRRQLSKTALSYLKSKGCPDAKARFDVVAVSLGSGPPHIEVVRNAFELAYG